VNLKHLKQAEAAAAQERIADDLVGHRLQNLEWREHDWLFSFTTGSRLRVSCPWRIISGERISFAESDDGQQFGLPAPVNGAVKSKELLLGKTIEQIAIRADTADLTIAFRPGISLEIWNNSSGYEGWDLHDARGFLVVALGGGQLAIWGLDPKDKKTDAAGD
jgi:hypothetical protein